MSLALLAQSPLAIQIHVVTATLALVIGPFAIWRKRRDRLHKVAGYLFLSAMLAAILSSFLITSIRLIGPFSPIHLLSLIAFVSLALGLNHIRQRRIAQHAATMRGLYLQALGVAFLFTFLPGRLMNRIVFPESGTLGAVLVLGIGVPLLAGVIFAPTLRARFSPFLPKT